MTHSTPDGGGGRDMQWQVVHCKMYNVHVSLEVVMVVGDTGSGKLCTCTMSLTPGGGGGGGDGQWQVHPDPSVPDGGRLRGLRGQDDRGDGAAESGCHHPSGQGSRGKEEQARGRRGVLY